MRLKVFGVQSRVYSQTGRDFDAKLAVAGYDDGLGRVVKLTDLQFRAVTSASIVATNNVEGTAFATVSSTLDVTIDPTNSAPGFDAVTLGASDDSFSLIPGNDRASLVIYGSDSQTTAITGPVSAGQLNDGFLVNIDVEVSNSIQASAFVTTNPVSNRLNAYVFSQPTFLAKARDYTDARDQVIGGAASDVVSLLGGNDTFEGRAGGDAASGGAGRDVLRGGAGRDNLLGDAGRDRLFGDNDADLLSGGGGNDLLNGGDGNDDLRGGGGADTLFGGAGADTLSGGDKGDRLEGGIDNDTMAGNNGDDVLIAGSGDDILKGGQGADRLAGGAGGDELEGGTQGDVLLGGAGADTLRGGDGDDRIDGGTDNDTLSGGRGADTFIFRQADGQDRIEGFNPDADRFLVKAGMVAAFDTAQVVFGDTVITFSQDHTITLEDFTQIELLPALVDTL